jgi:hypothetical protein
MKSEVDFTGGLLTCPSPERPLSAFRIAVLAGFHESLRVAYCLVFDENDYLLFRSWIKEVV